MKKWIYFPELFQINIHAFYKPNKVSVFKLKLIKIR